MIGHWKFSLHFIVLHSKLTLQHQSYVHTIATILQPLYRTILISQHPQDFVGAEFYCLHALADSNWRPWIKEKMIELSSMVLPALPPYLRQSYMHMKQNNNHQTSLTISQQLFQLIKVKYINFNASYNCNLYNWIYEHKFRQQLFTS